MIGTIIDTLATLWVLRGAWNMTSAYLTTLRVDFREAVGEGWARNFCDVVVALLILGSTALLLAAIWL